MLNKSGNAFVFGAKAELRSRKVRIFSNERVAEVIGEIQGKLTEGLSSVAKKILANMLENYSHTVENTAKFHRLLSYTLETQGNYKEALKAIEKYDDEELLGKLNLETQISIITQLAISLNNTNDYPRAVALLNYALEEAKEVNSSQTFGEIYLALARVYRKLNEFPISRDHAEKALAHYRTEGDWVGNVRQLCNEIQRVVARAEDGEKITPEHLSTDLKKSAKSITQFSKGENVKPIASYDSLSTSFNISSSTGTLEEAVCGLETQMIKEALSRHKWNISQAARELGLTRRGLYMKIARYGVEKAA
ncbi:MAG: hypothetical protein M3Q33_05200 [Acidobacteriota bacterium]|nr:hypothetical protein [Acidobacteriota bacterium]